MDIKISIVLPVYNGAERIGKAIESVLHQTYSNWELIIVNDCSTDNTLFVIQEYEKKDNRIKILNNSTNQKLPRSLNVGFEHACGEYFTWTSDDNRYHTDALQLMYTVLENDPHTDLVYADCNIVDLNENLISEDIKKEPDSIRFGSIVGACFLYRRSLADMVGKYDPDMFLAEDYDFFLRCYINGNLYHLNKTLYDYGMHERSLTSSHHNDILRQTYKVMNMHFDFLYSHCPTVKEKNLLFFSMLYYITDKNEKEKALRRFYKLSSSFRFVYLKGELIKNFKSIIRNSIKPLLSSHWHVHRRMD